MIKLFETFGLKFGSYKGGYLGSESDYCVYELPIAEKVSLKARYSFKGSRPEKFEKDFAIIDEKIGDHNVYFGVGCRASDMDPRNLAEKHSLYGQDLIHAYPAYNTEMFKNQNDKIVAFDNFVKAILNMPKMLDSSQCSNFRNVVDKIKTSIEEDKDGKKGGAMKRMANLCENGIYPLLLLLAMDETIDSPRNKEIFTLFATDKGFQEDFINFSKALVTKPQESGMFSSLFSTKSPEQYFVISRDEIIGHLVRTKFFFDIFLEKGKQDADDISDFIYKDLLKTYRPKSFREKTEGVVALDAVMGDQVFLKPSPIFSPLDQPLSQSAKASSGQQQSNAPTTAPTSAATTAPSFSLGTGSPRKDRSPR